MVRRILLISAILFLCVIILILIGEMIFNSSYKFPKIEYGVTFSAKYAKYLGLDWKQTYIKILDDLKVKKIRIPSYWNDLEKSEGEFNFEEEDFMVKEAEKRGVKMILALGVRQPRWPECHVPYWAKNLSLEGRRGRVLQFIEKVVNRYKNNSAVTTWQVENEPFLPFFGENCDQADVNFLTTEVNLVRSLSKKTIIVTDSGELGLWVVPMQVSDIFGTTLYRDVYNPILGSINYPILPYLYNLKSLLIKNIFARENQKTIIVELQAEPWLPNGVRATSFDQQVKIFPVEKLENYTNYAQKTGFDEMYFWGVEWWYWMSQNGYPQYLNYAKTLFK